MTKSSQSQLSGFFEILPREGRKVAIADKDNNYI
jgi:hypothetical protein